MSSKALIMVKDVSGVASLAKSLVGEFGFELWGNEIACEALTGLGVSIKLAKTSEAVAMIENPAEAVRLVVANFVDVESAGRAFMSWKSALSAFDRGIVSSLRAAAWAVDRVAVIGNPSDYDAALQELSENGGKFRQAFRMERATAAFRAASEFDFAVGQYLEVQGADKPDMGALSGYSKALRFAWPRLQLLEHGENGHQLAALYGSFSEHFEQVCGPKLDYTSILSVSKAAYLIGEFEKPAAALLRNGKIVTAACGSDLAELVAGVLKDEDARGSWLVANGSLGESVISEAIESGVVGILSPDLTDSERELLSRTGKVSALVSLTGLGYEALQEIRSVAGGVLVQDKDRAPVNPMEWTPMSLAQPLVEDWESLMFGAKVVRHADSEALAIVSGERLIWLAAGEVSTRRAWQVVEESGVGLDKTVAVFDSPEVDPKILPRMKEFGVRVALVTAGGDEQALRDAANSCGLVLLSAPKSWRKF